MINILSQALNLDRFKVMYKKVVRRFFDSKQSLTKDGNLDWLKKVCTSFEAFAANIDAQLWKDSIEAGDKIKKDAQLKLSEIKHQMGGGGHYQLLHFMVKLLDPEIVVETGVAAGFSSYALLKAIQENKKGRLYSSDFPYFRLPEPEKLIGIVVPEELKSNWELFIEGDEINLKKILERIGNKTVDLFHYDSDKSYAGRTFAMKTLQPKMSENGIIIFDDIQDNSFFYDLVNNPNDYKWYVFEFEGKYVGMIGNNKAFNSLEKKNS